MPNPYLPLWEYIPDGEPRVFGDRVYIYGSHDRAGSDDFCDYVLKCWSAPVNDLNNWVCHGVTFRVKPDGDFPSDTDWTPDKNQILFAPDVVCTLPFASVLKENLNKDLNPMVDEQNVCREV